MALLGISVIVAIASMITIGWCKNPTTHTNCGPIQGVIEDDAMTFKGIPYSLPPVGDRRWQKPIPLSGKTCWNGTYSADKFGSNCYQRGIGNASHLFGSEDCLFLNVWTPTTKKGANLPVMVWIHGGFLLYTSGNWPTYAPSGKLAKDLNMVFVSMNYRLNAFGFMALDILSAASETGTSGNYGFMDQILALKWVQHNIANFGGDPEKVTIFGQSSGGTSIFALLAAPQTVGLYNRAWMLSGSPILNKTLDQASQDNVAFLNKTGCHDLKCLLNLTPKKVEESISWNVFPNWAMSDQGDIPEKGFFDGGIAIVDGDVLKQAPFDAWKAGRMVEVPLVIGTMAQELDFSPAPPGLKNWTLSNYTEHVHAILGTFSTDIANEALKLYPPLSAYTPEYLFTTMGADVRVTCGNDVMASHAAQSFTPPIYRYVATSTPSAPVHPLDSPFASVYAFHLWDSFAFLGTIDQYIKEPKASDIAFQKLMQKEFSNFAMFGVPATKEWLPYPNSTAILNENITIVKEYSPNKCKFWLDNGFFSYSWIN